jgi:hypothetical protein
MKIFTTLFALVGLIFLTSIVNVASAVGSVPYMPYGICHSICGVCEIKDVGNVTIPIVSYFYRNMKPYYKCNTRQKGACLDQWLAASGQTRPLEPYQMPQL